jgi:hypothetical protein
MSDALRPDFRTEIDEAAVSAASWSAILAGGVACAALTLLLLAFGVGMGLSVVSPWSNSGVSSTTFGIGAGLYLIVVAMISSSIGGYLAGRLRTKWVGVHGHEVYFRDTAHGFLAWAFATILSAAILTSAASHIVGGASAGLPQAATAQSGGSMGMYADMLLRADSPATGNSADIAASRGELVRLLSSSLANGGDLSPTDRAYAARVVAARTGLSPAEAEKRVAEVITQAKSAAETARKTAAHLAIWVTISLLLGAFCASLAATEGGGLRDGTWKY